MGNIRERIERIRVVMRKNSLFVRIFAGLSLLSLGMVLFLGFWMNNISSRNYRRQMALSSLSRLKQADEAMDLIAEVLSQNMAQVMWSNDFITYLVSPGRSVPEQDYRMLRQLKSVISGSELVQGAFLYSPFTGKVYDSEVICQAEEFEDWPILEEHFREPGKGEREASTMTTTTVMAYDGRLFVVQDLDIPSHIGTLVYDLNIQALADTLGLEGALGESDVFVYDGSGGAVFDGLLSYGSVTPDWGDTSLFVNPENMEERAGRQTRGFYRYDAPKSGWVYLMPLNTKNLSMNYRTVLPMYLLAAAVFLLVSIAFDFYVSNSIYRPINRLLKLVTQTDGRQRESGSGEVDFLEGAYSDALDQQSQLKGLIVNIAPEILDSMLKNLMVGKTLEEQRVAEILEGVGNPIGVYGRYLVLVCQMCEPKGREVTDVELNLHLLSIKNLVEGTDTTDYRMYDIRTEKMIVSIVMGFPHDYPVVNIKKECARLSQLLRQLGEKIPYRLQVERGSIYQNIMDIRYAYREALDKLQYQQYLESSEEPADGEEIESDCSQVVNRRYFKERTKALVEQAGQGNREDSETLIHQIMADLGREDLGIEELRGLAEVFLDELTEKVITLPLSEEDQHLLESTHAATELTAAKTREALMNGVLEYARMAVGLLHVYNRKNSYKYVKQAKEYIAQNYADSNLSLNDVCEHIGISASYLSELFNEISGEKFSAYLASFRVEKASQLLRTTNVTIKEIGFRCGFNSIQNFIRVFKKYMDQTPGYYRESQS